MPVPLSLCLTEASRHDLPVLKEQIFVPLPGVLFGDKAYRDQTTECVQSSFHEGLRVHCYGKLTAAFYLLCFNS